MQLVGRIPLSAVSLDEDHSVASTFCTHLNEVQTGVTDDVVRLHSRGIAFLTRSYGSVAEQPSFLEIRS